MTGTCEQCGGDVTGRRTDGTFRLTCWDCIEQAAASEPAHVETCTREECVVCADYRRDNEVGR